MFNRIKFIDKIRNSPFAWWEWDIQTNSVQFNDLKVTMLGYAPEDYVNCGFEAFTNLLHPDDYDSTMEAMRKVLRNDTSLYQVDYRILSKDSGYRWYMDRGSVFEYNASGRPSRLRGIVIDLGREVRAGTNEDALIRLMKSSVITSNNKNIFYMTICSNCGNAKVDAETWIEITEELMDSVTDEISHGICPRCLYTLYPDMADDVINDMKK